MKILRILAMGLVLGGMLVNTIRAEEKGKTPEKVVSKEKVDDIELRRAAAVANFAKVAQLVSYARGELAEGTILEKSYTSPENLVAAGALLLQAATVLGDELESVDENGEVDKSAKAKPVSLKAQARSLLDEATVLVVGNQEKENALKNLIAKAEKISSDHASKIPDRGAVGKPRTITRVVEPGQTVTLTIGFHPQAPGSVSYDTLGGGNQRFEIIGPNGRTIYDNTGRSGGHSWMTVGDDAKRMITIRITNVGKAPHSVTVTTN